MIEDGRSLAEHVQSFQHLRESSLEIAYFSRGINSKENSETINEKSSRAVVLEADVFKYFHSQDMGIPYLSLKKNVLHTIKDNHF